MKGRFVFHPVGQGLFYTGEISEGDYSFRFVYDCGGDFIQRETDEYINSLNGSKIDLLVLSHLHEDHINGIDVILKNMARNGRVIFPYCSSSMRIMYLWNLEKRGKNSGEVKSFCEDPVSYIKGKTGTNSEVSIIQVSKRPEEMLTGEESESYSKERSVIESEDVLNAGRFIFRKKRDQNVFLTGDLEITAPFCAGWKIKISQPFFDIEKYKEYRKILADNGICDLDSLRINHDVLKQLRMINYYQNKSCLIMQHGYGLHKDTVLCGDLPESKNKNIRDEVGVDPFVFQIPHHGGKTRCISVNNAENCVVSYGLKNHYRHPDKDVIKNYRITSTVHELTEASSPYMYCI